jgi:hypothetical protein
MLIFIFVIVNPPALELFTQGETISDVVCDDCNAKVNTLKRCVVKVRVA